MDNAHVEEAFEAKIDVESLEDQLQKARFRLTMALGTLSPEERSAYSRKLIEHHANQPILGSRSELLDSLTRPWLYDS